jgi:hypothetical protein
MPVAISREALNFPELSTSKNQLPRSLHDSLEGGWPSYSSDEAGKKCVINLYPVPVLHEVFMA